MSSTANDVRGTGGTAAREMPLIHRIFRHEFRSLRQLVTALPQGDTKRVTAVADHLAFMLDSLHMHHTTEDDLVWPLVRERDGGDALLATRMEEQHRDIDTAVARVRLAAAMWSSAPTERSTATLEARLDEFLRVVDHHLDEEERDVVPLIDRHLTIAEWEEVGKRGFEKFTPSQRWIALGQLLEVATSEEAAMMLDKLPLPVRVLWRLVGRRTYGRYIAPIRGEG